MILANSLASQWLFIWPHQASNNIVTTTLFNDGMRFCFILLFIMTTLAILCKCCFRQHYFVAKRIWRRPTRALSPGGEYPINGGSGYDWIVPVNSRAQLTKFTSDLHRPRPVMFARNTARFMTKTCHNRLNKLLINFSNDEFFYAQHWIVLVRKAWLPSQSREIYRTKKKKKQRKRAISYGDIHYKNQFSSAKSLHRAGRALDVTLCHSRNLTMCLEENLPLSRLSKLALESKFSFVRYNIYEPQLYNRPFLHISCPEREQEEYNDQSFGCFPATSTVHTSNGRQSMRALRIGDVVKTLDEDGHVFYTPIIAFLHRNTTQRLTYLRVVTSYGVAFTLSPNHLVYRRYSDGSVRPTFANSLNVGNYTVVLYTDTDSVDYVRVVRVSTVPQSGVYAPLTAAGTILVDGVLCSCYAHVNSHTLAHLSVSPLRWWHNTRMFFGAVLDALSFLRHTSSPEGIHPYAQFLHDLGRLLLPQSYFYS